MGQDGKVASATLEIAAPADRIFELIADPAEQPSWDGNDNLAEAATGQRVRGVGDVFLTTISQGGVRENHVVEFEEGRVPGFDFVRMQDELSRLLGGRRVDLVTPRALSPFLRERVLRSAVTRYAA